MTLHRASPTLREIEEDFRRVYALVKYNERDGMVRWGDSPDPLMLVWSPRIFEFLHVLERLMTYPPARGICREVGYKSGYDGAVETARPMGVDGDQPVKVLLLLPRVLGGAGWGVSEVAYDDETHRIEWAFPRGTAISVAAREAGPRTAPACAFIEGFGAGWVQASVGRAVEFLEVECVGMGNASCRFDSRPLEE